MLYDILLPALIGAAVMAVLLAAAYLLMRQPQQPNPPDTPAPTPPPDNNAEVAARLARLEAQLSAGQQAGQQAAYNQTLLLNRQLSSLEDNVNQLQRLFRNVKLRGSWGEVQLAAVLSEFLSPTQYEANVAIDPEAAERVEFAVKLPLPDNTFMWLPIDAKCPIEDFERLQAAAEQNDRDAADKAEKALSRRLLAEAADIAAKYIRPPYSTDFALLFLPIESIYQWLLTQTDLMQTLQTRHRVIPCGPSTVSAVLNLVQLSHQTLSLSQSEGEVWQYLAGVKQELANFEDALTKTQKKAAELTAHLETLSRRLRVLQRRLNQLENPGETNQN
ncbi:MAG: DNA recombination protein RmuC [Firmicutes bacterium]|nr:DNA recombination protein RmuC [Bacillota bacterium]